MKAFIPAAGLGTRLRPFTLDNPKALVPVDGIPMLERVIDRLKRQGFDDFIINLHHFGDKIEEFVKSKRNFGVKIQFSDERDRLLDTGGGLLHAAAMLTESSEPFLIHNVDILSNADLHGLMESHYRSDAAASLLVSKRESSRRLLFDENMALMGWHDVKNNLYRPSGVNADSGYEEFAFSGIHVMTPERVFAEMKRQGRSGVFSVIDFYLDAIDEENIRGVKACNLQLIDIGKPETLAHASHIFKDGGVGYDDWN